MGASRQRDLSGRLHLIRYAVGWIVGGAIVAGIAVTLVRSDADDRVSLPPVHQIELTSAARGARCELREASPRDDLYPRAGHDVSPRAARPATYERPPAREELVGALRRGIIVIQYDPGLPDEQVDQLETVQRAVPNGTIVTPLEMRGRHAAVTTAYRRRLGCPDVSRATVDAIRLFRGRFIGSGQAPD